MKSLDGQVCVVTGAGSGLGRHVAMTLSRFGGIVVAIDVDQGGLDGTCETITRSGGSAFAYLADVSRGTEIDELASKVAAQHGSASVLVNNAGVMHSPTELDAGAVTDFDWLLGVNLAGVVNVSRAFLPHLRTQSDAHIVNVSSLAGLVGMMGFSSYCASKFAVRGFTEALRMDLNGTPIKLTTAYPGAVNTNIIANARGYSEQERKIANNQLTRMKFTDVESAANQIVRGILRNKSRVLIGPETKLIDLLVRLFPSGYVRLLHPAMKRMTSPARAGKGSPEAVPEMKRDQRP